MQQPPKLTDTTTLSRFRNRARAKGLSALFLQEEAAWEIQERLSEVNRRFTEVAIVTPFPEVWQPLLPEAHIVQDQDLLPLAPGAYDLVIHSLSLHWANDPVGQLIQARRSLKPDGLFLCASFGGQTLAQLRVALSEAEIALTGGLSPRVVPMAEIRELGALLHRAGFALPVADTAIKTVTYGSVSNLLHDLRAMGECNALAQRLKSTPRRLFERADALYIQHFAQSDGRIPATFELVFLTGWAPDDSQQQPLRPGSAKSRLADALSTSETLLEDPMRRDRS